MSKFNFENLASTRDDVQIPSKGYLDLVADHKQMVQMIKVSDLEIIMDQPFKAYEEQALKELAEDIQKNGLLSPLIVQPKAGKYRVLAGRNRLAACKMNGMAEVSCIIKDVDDDTANLILVNSNLNQRHELTLTEKAKAYQLQVQSMANLKNISYRQATNEIAEQEETSQRNIYRYLRLADLHPDLLSLVDQNIIGMKAAVILGDLPTDQQYQLYEYLVKQNKKITNEKKANELLNWAKVQGLNFQSVENFFHHEPNAKCEMLKVNYDHLAPYLNGKTKADEIENLLIEALKFYFSNLNKEEKDM